MESTIIQIDGSNKKITGICQEISVAHLISLEKKKIYDINEFDEKQTEHRAIMRAKLENAYANIKETIAISYDKCSSDLEEVRIAWDEYRRRVSVLYLFFFFAKFKFVSWSTKKKDESKLWGSLFVNLYIPLHLEGIISLPNNKQDRCKSMYLYLLTNVYTFK